MAFGFVNTVGAFNDASGGSLSAAATSLTAGNLIVVWAIYTSATATTNIPTDTAGNVYVQATGGFSRQSSEVIDCWYAKNALGNAANVVQFTPSVNSTFRRIITQQYSGSGGASCVQEVGNSGTIASNVTVTTGNLVITGTNNMIAALGTNGTGTGTYSAGTSMALRGATIGTDTQGEDRLNIAAGTYTASITLNAAAQQWIGAVSFSDAALPGGAAFMPRADNIALNAVRTAATW